MKEVFKFRTRLDESVLAKVAFFANNFCLRKGQIPVAFVLYSINRARFDGTSSYTITSPHKNPLSV